MDNDFKDVLSIFSDEPEKKENSASEEPKPSEEQNQEASSAASPSTPAAATGGFKKPMGGKGLQRPLPGGKFARPASPGTPLSAAAGQQAPAPPTPAATQAPPPSPDTIPSPVAIAPMLTPPPAQAGSSLNKFLLILVLIFSLISLLVSAAAMAKVSGMRTEMKLLNENMKAVRVSADRSWQIKCGIYAPVPNQRPQEYMIKYEEKNGQLIKKEMIIRPVE